MGRFAAAAKQRTNITLAKHNAECRVRECEAQLRMRRGELQDVVVGLQSIDRAIEDLWEEAGPDMIFMAPEQLVSMT